MPRAAKAGREKEGPLRGGRPGPHRPGGGAPAFAHAENSELAALVSDDPEKLAKLGRRYKVKARFSYDQYEECLQSGGVDAVYIALPNHLHREYTERAARAGVHVLCEKPMAVTEEDCLADDPGVRGERGEADGGLPAPLRGGEPQGDRTGAGREVWETPGCSTRCSPCR